MQPWVPNSNCMSLPSMTQSHFLWFSSCFFILPRYQFITVPACISLNPLGDICLSWSATMPCCVPIGRALAPGHSVASGKPDEISFAQTPTPSQSAVTKAIPLHRTRHCSPRLCNCSEVGYRRSTQQVRTFSPVKIHHPLTLFFQNRCNHVTLQLQTHHKFPMSRHLN